MDDWFTAGSVATFAGATGVVVVVCQALIQALGLRWRPLPLIVSLIVASVAAAIADQDLGDWGTIGLVFVNGCLLYCTAFGFSTTILKPDMFGIQSTRFGLEPWPSLIP